MPWILDILLFLKCKLGYINICNDNYVSLWTGSSRRGASGIFLKNVYAETSLFRDSFFVRIPNLWKALPSELKYESNVNDFKNKLRTFYFTRLHDAFDADDAHTFKLVCCKCRRIYNLVKCSCWIIVIIIVIVNIVVVIIIIIIIITITIFFLLNLLRITSGRD